MSEHVNQLLHAYHDGELPEWQVDQVAAHLAECEPCREELNGLRQLSDLLQTMPDMEGVIDSKDFVRQVQRKLDSRPRPSNWQRGFRMSWQLAPLGMLLVLVFVQTTLQLNNLVTLLGLFGGDQVENSVALLQSRMPAGLPVSLPNYGLNAVRGLPWGSIGIGALFGFDLTFNLTLPTMISLLAVSWLTGWWVAQQNNKTSGIKE